MIGIKPGDWVRAKIDRPHPVIVEGETWGDGRYLHVGAYSIYDFNCEINSDVEILERRPARPEWMDALVVRTDKKIYGLIKNTTQLRWRELGVIEGFWYTDVNIADRCASGVPVILIDKDGKVVAGDE